MKEYKLKINGNDYAVTIADIEDNIADVEVNGIPFTVEIDSNSTLKKSVSTPKPTTQATKPVMSSVENTIAKPTVSVQPPVSSTNETPITSPLPGVILEISVKEGDVVKKGQKLMILEAMKMENVIESGTDGKVLSIKVKASETVMEGAVLITIG